MIDHITSRIKVYTQKNRTNMTNNRKVSNNTHSKKSKSKSTRALNDEKWMVLIIKKKERLRSKMSKEHACRKHVSRNQQMLDESNTC